MNNALRDKDEAQFNYKKTCEEKECYETQLTETQKKLVASREEVEKLRNTIDRLDKERNKQMEGATNIRSLNTTLIIQKKTLEDKLRNGVKISLKHQGVLEEL